MAEANDDISIANVTAYLGGGHKVENIIEVETVGDVAVLHSDEGCCITHHHIDPKNIIGFSHVKF
jgi:hypothetical protein